MTECQGTIKPHRDPVRKITVLEDHFYTGDPETSWMGKWPEYRDEPQGDRSFRYPLGSLLPVTTGVNRGHWRITVEFVPHVSPPGGDSPWYSEVGFEHNIYPRRYSNRPSGGEQSVCDPHAEGHARCEHDDACPGAAARTPAAEVTREGGLADG